MKNRCEGAFREWALAEGLINPDALAEAGDALTEIAEENDRAEGLAARAPLSEAQEREAQRRAVRMLRERAPSRPERDSGGISKEVRKKFSLHGIADLLPENAR